MPYTLELQSENNWILTISGEPSYIHALPMAAQNRETELNFGHWLVVCFPVWSGPVRDAVHSAIAFAKHCNGRLHVGIRPFDSTDELLPSWPEVTSLIPSENGRELRNSGEGIHISTAASAFPLWVLLSGGEILLQFAGSQTEEELRERMFHLIS